MLLLLLSLAALWQDADANAIFKSQVRGARSQDVVYKIGDISDTHLTPQMIKDGLAFINENTCINLIDQADAPHRAVDMPIETVPEEKQCEIYNGTFVIGDCISNRKAMIHEVTHFLGFCHTQNRLDWRDYMKIMPSSELTTFDHPSCMSIPVPEFKYDYGSGMHHNMYSDAKPLDMAYESTVGQGVRFPFSDYRSINWLYNCSGKCVSQPKCENGGYTHPRDCNRCMCNGYFTGNHCETPRNLIKLSCESKPQHVWSLNYPGNNTLLQQKRKLKVSLHDNYFNHGDTLWDLIEAPSDLQIQVEVESRAMAFSPPPSFACVMSVVEINDGDLNMVGRMFCDDPNFRKVNTFTARTSRVGMHAEYALEYFATMRATFTLLGCDAPLQPTTTTTTAAPPTIPPATTTTKAAMITTPVPSTATTTPEADTTTTTAETESETTTTTAHPAATTTTTDTPIEATTTNAASEQAWCDDM